MSGSEELDKKFQIFYTMSEHLKKQELPHLLDVCPPFCTRLQQLQALLQLGIGHYSSQATNIASAVLVTWLHEANKQTRVWHP